jgi:NADPH2:quinone reductase
VSLGHATGALRLAPEALGAKSLTFSQPVVFDYVTGPGQLAMRAERVWQALAEGAIQLPPIERFALDAAAAAHARLESRGSTGALVLLP